MSEIPAMSLFHPNSDGEVLSLELSGPGKVQEYSAVGTRRGCHGCSCWSPCPPEMSGENTQWQVLEALSECLIKTTGPTDVPLSPPILRLCRAKAALTPSSQGSGTPAPQALPFGFPSASHK